MDPFIGQIILFAGNFAPRGWAFCEGQLLAISSHDALFSILGTTYGGDGRSTFGLPSLRGRTAIHAGTGPGLSPRPLGQKSGMNSVVLNTNELPHHTHTATLHGENAAASSPNPAGNMLGATPNNPAYAAVTAGNDKAMGSGSIIVNHSGGNLAHNNMQPYLGLNYIIALVGVYPSRS